MKQPLVLPFLVLLVLLSACGGPVVIAVPTATAQPSLPTPTATRPPTETPTLVPTRTATALPSPTSTVTATPAPAISPSPTPACYSVFLPTGYLPGGKHLMGLMSVNEVPGTALQVLDLQNFEARTLARYDEPVAIAALSPDGETAAWALPDFSIQFVRLSDGKVTATLTGHTGMVNALVFSPDGSRLYSASSDTTVIAWDVKKGTQKSTFRPTFYADGWPSDLLGLGISPDGKTLVTIPSDGAARAWDTTTFDQVAEYPGAISGGYNGAQARYSTDGKYLAIGLAAGPGDTTLWRVADTTLMWSGGMMAGFDFSPDSRLFAHVELDENNRSQIVIRSADGQAVRQTIATGSETLVWNLRFSPGGATIAAIDGSVLRFWDAGDGSPAGSYTPPCPERGGP